MNNKLIVQSRLDVVNREHLNLLNFETAYTLKDIIEAITGVVSISLWPSSNDSLCVHFNPNQRNEVVWAIQAELDKQGLIYGTFGQYAPPTANWDGYKELKPDIRQGVEQRTEAIKSQYESLNRHIKAANNTAWSLGRLLSEQQTALAHNKKGGFEGYLKAEFPQWNRRIAYRFLDIYQAYPNCDIMSQLEVGLTVLYKLSAPSTPESAREEVATLAEQGEKVTVAQVTEIIASHKPTIPDSLLWLPERLRKAVINGYFNLSVDHLQALSPLEGLNTIGAPMLGVSTFDKHTDIPTPQALYNRLSTIGGLSADEVEAVVSRMVAVCKPSPNEVDLSDFTEADFAELSAAGEGEPSEKRLDETGIKGYFFVNGGKAVWCEFTDKTLTLDEFEEIKAKHAKPRKSASHSNGNGSSGHTRTAEQVHGDSLAAGISRGYVAQAERANGERADMVRELGKMSEDALNLLSAAIAKAIGFNDTVFNPISYIADFVMSEVSGEVQS